MKAGFKRLSRAIVWCSIVALGVSTEHVGGSPTPRHDKTAKSKSSHPLPFSNGRFIRALAISPDGQWLAASLGRTAGRWDAWGTTWLLNLTSGEARLINPGPAGGGYTVVFSTDSRTLAVGSWTAGYSGISAMKNADYAVQLWDVSTGNELPGFWPDVCTPLLRPTTCAANWVAFSRDGKVLAAATESGGFPAIPVFYDMHNLLRLWNRQTQEPLKLSTSYHSFVGGLAFSPDNTHLAVADYKHISLLDIGERKEVYRYECGATCFRPQFSPDGKFLAAVDRYGRIRVWDIDTNKEYPSPQVQASRFYTVDFCFVGQTLVTSGEDNAVRFWEVPSGREIRNLAFPQGAPYPLLFTQDGQSIFGGGRGDKPVIYIWDANTGQEIKHWDLTAVLIQGAP